MDELSRRFNRVFETLEAGNDLFAEEALFDLNMPVWRFQILGPAAFASQLKHINRGPAWVNIVRTVPTASGFVTEHVEHQEVDGQDLSARRLWLCEVDGGRISQVVGYCTGEWDEALRARHVREAPMVRP
jgi:hypothetical protein